ncbi:MAG: TetR/AcrR family transcriptional regulator [Microbacterium sp.]|jgi:AcrR family transcriptional regulator|nr:TetR/AcrR family transcriptional regulator [Microbacterium sp.]
MTRRRHYGEAVRREEIVTAAIGSVARGGMAQATLARIAEAAGLTNAAVLYYFSGKADVIDAAYLRVVADMGEQVGAAMAEAPTGRSSVDAYVRSLTGFLSGHPDHLRFLVRYLAARSGEPLETDGATPRWTPLAQAIARGCDEGELSCADPRTAAIAIGGAIDAIFAEAMDDPGYDVDAATDTLLEMIHRALDGPRA